MAKPPRDDEHYSEAEATERRETILKRMLNTPPEPHATLKSKAKRKGLKPRKRPRTKRAR
jgi:hypothetical protein